MVFDFKRLRTDGRQERFGWRERGMTRMEIGVTSLFDFFSVNYVQISPSFIN